MFDGLSSIAGPVMTVAGAMTANPALMYAGMGMSAYSAMQGQKDANQMNADIAGRANQFNADQSTAQMMFQERMSNTSYQRAVNDLQAAGLNPMLAYMQGGASTPTGAAAAATMPHKMENVAAPGVNSATQAAQTMLAVQNSAADVQLKNQQANTQAAQQEQSYTQAALNKAEAAKSLSQTYNPGQFGKMIDQQVNTYKAQEGSYNAGASASYASAKQANSLTNLYDKGRAPNSSFTYNALQSGGSGILDFVKSYKGPKLPDNLSNYAPSMIGN